MSISVMNAVWNHSQHKGGALNLMLAIADFADDAGVAFPGVEKLSQKIRMTERNTRILIHKLEESGELTVASGKGPHGTNRYVIQLAALGKQPKKVTTTRRSHPQAPEKTTGENIAEGKSFQPEKNPQGGMKKPKKGDDQAISRSTMHDPPCDPSMHGDNPPAPTNESDESVDGWMHGPSAQALWAFGVRDTGTLKKFAALPLAVVQREIALIQQSRSANNPPAALVRNLKRLPQTAWQEQPPPTPAAAPPADDPRRPDWIALETWRNLTEPQRDALQHAQLVNGKIQAKYADWTDEIYRRWSPMAQRLVQGATR